MKRALLTLVFLLICPALRAGNCSFNSPFPTLLDFGVYQPLTGSVLQQAISFSVECVPPETVTVQFSKGQSTTFDPRVMSFGAGTLPYNIFSNAARTKPFIWGDSTGGTVTASKTMTPGDRTLDVNVYGQIDFGTLIDPVPSAPGFYTDTIVVTIIWSGGAKSSTKSFQVRVRVDPECTVTTLPLAFGNYDPVSANKAAALPGTGTINVKCTSGTTATVLLDNGSHASGSTRQMLGPSSNLLQYEIYLNPGRTTRWGTTAPNVVSGTSTSKNTAINGGFTAYGLIGGGQDVIVGSYSDNVLVTVNY